jgi:hypothetical protein
MMKQAEEMVQGCLPVVAVHMKQFPKTQCCLPRRICLAMKPADQTADGAVLLLRNINERSPGVAAPS